MTLDIDRIRRETFVARAEHHPSIGSTNDRAAECAADGQELPLLVVADRQTAGRGRGANRWWTGAGGLAFSLLVDGRMVGADRGRSPLLALAAAAAVIDAVAPLLPPVEQGRRVRPRRTTFLADGGASRTHPTQFANGASRTHPTQAVLSQQPIGLYWPNDVIVGGRKLAGILIEVLPNGQHVIGIGLNTGNSLADAPAELRAAAVTLLDLTGRRCDQTEILVGLLRRLEGEFARLRSEPQAIADRANALCLQRSRMLTLQSGQRMITGRCCGIAADGSILLETPAGVEAFCSGIVLKSPSQCQS